MPTPTTTGGTTPARRHPPGPSDNRQPKWAWWVIGILIPVLAIVIPVLATVWLTSQEDDAANNAAPSTSPSAEETEADPPSTTAPTSPVSSASPTASVRWTGEVRIAEDGLTLDEMPPEHIPGGDGDIKLGWSTRPGSPPCTRRISPCGLGSRCPASSSAPSWSPPRVRETLRPPWAR